ncbi:hypothetical protein EYF80_018127 [Liparis tanakae]|uniref:Uncharacterized protein n=1 Tax=Liparis tanakae TaxID=230148 RepID=A0A4Z2I2X6_9TELE|nr:hypothetical protein EYF80_018127 [Liparis tanakae]
MLLLVQILWFLPLTGAAPSQMTEQLDTGVIRILRGSREPRRHIGCHRSRSMAAWDRCVAAPMGEKQKEGFLSVLFPK